MANLYGVANCPGSFSYSSTIGATDIICPAGANTPVITVGPFQAPSNGYFFVAAWANMTIFTGATAPTALNCGIIIASGTTGSFIGPTYTINVPSTEIYVPVTLISAPSQVAWQGPGSTVTITVNPAGQQVTCRNGGTWGTFLLLRAPDQ